MLLNRDAVDAWPVLLLQQPQEEELNDDDDAVKKFKA